MGELSQMRLEDFIEAVAAKTPTPGGGSAAALAGALGAALGIMAARYSEGEVVGTGASKLEGLKAQWLPLVDEDAKAYDLVHSARGLPKGTEEEKKRRSGAIQNALKEAAAVPLQGMRLAVEALEVLRSMGSRINPNLASDLGTAACLLEAGLQGCDFNVRINADSIKDRKHSNSLRKEGSELLRKGGAFAAQILREVRKGHEKG